MYCSHDEADLIPIIVAEGTDDWIVISCKACGSCMGQRERLIDLLDRAIRGRRDRLDGKEPV